MRTLTDWFHELVATLMTASKRSWEESYKDAMVFYRGLYEEMVKNPSAPAETYRLKQQEELQRKVAELQAAGMTYEDANILARASFPPERFEPKTQNLKHSTDHAAVTPYAYPDAAFPGMPPHLKKLLRAENATQEQWDHALANAQTILDVKQAGTLFSGLVQVIQEREGKNYDDAWSSASIRYPGVYRAMESKKR